jgi:hypothetical protein
MPDWQELVRQRLTGLALENADLVEVVEELASHLEDDYESLLHNGMSEEAAIHCVIKQIADPRALKSKIESSREKEQPMNSRVSQFWLPAFLTILLAMSFLMIIEAVGFQPWVSSAWGGPQGTLPAAVVYLPWLATLPFIGALGAHLSGRAGARRWTVFSSVLFPVVPYLAFCVIGLPTALLLDGRVAHNITPSALFVGFAAWVLLPSIALLAGGLPLHYFSRRPLTQDSVPG